MKKPLNLIFISVLAIFPNLVFAQSLQTLLTNIPTFISNVLIPFLFGIAFLIFVYNVIRYFVAGAENKNIQEDAKNIALYSVAAFVFLIVFFGIVRMLVNSSGLQGEDQPCADYQEAFGDVCPGTNI